MSKRYKPSAEIAAITTLTEADATLARIAALKRQLTALENTMNDDIAAVKLNAEAQAEPLRQLMGDLSLAVARYADQNKDALFTEKVRSRTLTFGTMGFRFSSYLDTVGNTSWKAVLAKLEDLGLDKFIRHTPEVDKERLKKASDEILKKVRCVVREKDEFFYELDEAARGKSTSKAA